MEHHTRWCDLLRSGEVSKLGDAIKASMTELAGRWNAPPFDLSAAASQPGHSSGGPAGSHGGGPPSKRQRAAAASESKNLPVVGFFKGKEICHNFNRGSCNDSNCPREHVCDVRGCAKKHKRCDAHK